MKNNKNHFTPGEIENFIAKFNLYEVKNFKIFLKSNGYFWWPLIRFTVADAIMVEKKLKWSSAIIDKNQTRFFRVILKYIKLIFCDFFTISMLCFKSIKTIYIGSRNIPDFVHSINSNKNDYLIIGNKEILEGKSYFINRNIIQLFAKILKFFVFIPKELLFDSEIISNEINTLFDINLDISKVIKHQYQTQIAYSWIWSLILFIIKDTKKIIFLNDNSQHTLIHQAKKRGIFTLEIQHGYIGNAHEGYTFPNLPFKVSTLPDQIIINQKIGEISYPVSQSKSKLIVKSLKRYKTYQERDLDILIGTAPKLIKETRSIIKVLTKTDLNIALKLHPADSIDSYKNFLNENNLKIYLGSEDIKLIAKNSKIYIPVFPLSTSAFDAHESGCIILTINYNSRKLSNVLDPINDYTVNSIKELPVKINELIAKLNNCV